MLKYTVYIGLNDKDTKKQELPTVEAYKVISNIAAEYCGGATLTSARGIYTHTDGSIVFEETVKAEIFSETEIDGSIKSFGNAVKIALNQESVIVEQAEITSYFM